MGKDGEALEGTLQGYKGRIDPVVKATLTWARDLLFSGQTARGYDLDFDGDAQWGCLPMEGLLLSLGGCMAIDVVAILKRFGQEITACRIELTGERNPEPPQYYRRVELLFHLTGRALDARRIDEAIRLSRETYSSCLKTLRPDLALTVRYTLVESPGT